MSTAILFNKKLLLSGLVAAPLFALQAQAVTRPSMGEQKTLVILANYSDDTSTPWTQDQIRQNAFGTASDFFYENSEGQTWLTGDVVGYYTLALTSAQCGSQDLGSQAIQLAKNDGVDVGAYKRVVIATPYSSSCSYGGVSGVGSGTVHLNGRVGWESFAHELGHNLGIYHSHGLQCGSQPLGSSCSNDEYGDTYDVMGRGYGDYTAFQKDRLGWLSQADIDTATGSGVYQLNPAGDTMTPGVKTVRIPKGIDPATGNQAWYFVEFRQDQGFDSYNTAVSKGVVIHSAVQGVGDSSYLLDMNDSSFWSPDLGLGSTFSDPDTGVSITTQYAGPGYAEVLVDTTQTGKGFQCQLHQPSISITPGASQQVTAGTRVSYSISVTNNDDPNCGNNTFSMDVPLPDGWSASIFGRDQTLAPGATGTATLMVTSDANAAGGTYPLNVSVFSGAYGDIATASYVIAGGSSNQAPVAQADSASTNAGTAVSIAVLANDSDPDGDTLTITGTSGVNGSAVIQGGNIVFTPASGFSGNTSFNYSISDGKGGTASATVTVSVAAANQAPVAVNDSASTNAGTAVSIPVLANDSDPDGDTLTITSVSGGNGSASIQGGNIVFTPASSFSGTTSFNYSISDGKGGSASATVTVSVAAVNHAPVAVNDSASTNAGTAVSIPVLANDYDQDGDSLTITSTSGGNGSLSVQGGYIVFTPASSFSGSTSFSYQISDGKGASASATVTVSVAAANHAPVAVNDSASVSSGSSVTITVLGNDYDQDGDSLKVTGINQGSKGSVILNGDGTLTYYPGNRFKGSDSFSYQISDGKGGTASATVSIGSLSSGGSGGGGKGKSGK
ncbi:Ig-like domain-containing protein [Gallaecimonas kandeliae]|uniref:Ig-like domain-containing protein n=1 Tax=Gallaecimonas kandeliae TaxID=3029055 RepID=UPI002647F43A|nr:Ig-like domain-containing protein [Gallaecimonas kandeliae]WKE65661.1 Ig-like domain-containing protein [Gallaecimonas kandeliae]